ncbi:DUF2968 domain-containing protein [Collimonas antrihumi]|uniref:DUF2968 domain-containing protein n=1 Tax=Collimonas antrihumi TaxID=1940615 RepID=UPI001B8D005E|nr:DUF2968 domain-containing protein [Collimonas antrihumi]
MTVSVRNLVVGVGIGLLVAGTAVADTGTNNTNSTFMELQQMMQNQSIDELRTAYNGSYGASLLFNKDERQYYVALFHEKKFWRVIKTSSDTQAERTYKNFASQSEKLAEVETRRIKLEADEQYIARQIAVGEARLLVLENDLAIQKQQESTVVSQQNQVREQVQLLTGAERAANRKMQSLKNRIRFLEEQQIKMDNAVD